MWLVAASLPPWPLYDMVAPHPPTQCVCLIYRLSSIKHSVIVVGTYLGQTPPNWMVPMKFLFLCVFCHKDWELGCEYAFGEHNSKSSILHGCWDKDSPSTVTLSGPLGRWCSLVSSGTPLCLFEDGDKEGRRGHSVTQRWVQEPRERCLGLLP